MLHLDPTTMPRSSAFLLVSLDKAPTRFVALRVVLNVIWFVIRGRSAIFISVASSENLQVISPGMSPKK